MVATPASRILRGLILLASAVALLWVLLLLGFDTHWQQWLLVTLGMCVFILPGGLLMCAWQKRLPLDAAWFVSYGFAASLVIISGFGLLGRSLGWTMEGLLLAWALLILAGLAVFVRRARGQPLFATSLSASDLAILLSAGLAASLFAFSGMHHQPYEYDRHHYHVEVFSYLDGNPFDWREPFYDTGWLADRQAISYWTLAQAMVSRLSGQHIIHMDFIVNSLLMLVAMCGAHCFARNLGRSARNAWLVVLLHLLCLSLLLSDSAQPGAHFYMYLLTDKMVAGFALAPLALSSAYRALESPYRLGLVEFAIVFLAMFFVHVMMAGFVLVAVIFFCLARLLMRRRGQLQSARLLLLALALFSPAVYLRTQTDTRLIIYDYGVEAQENSAKVAVIDALNPLDGLPMYMIQPSAVGLPAYILLAAVLLAAMLRRHEAESSLLIALVMTALIALLPFTAWLYGRLLTPSHMMRVMTILPYGYMLFFVGETFSRRWGGSVPSKTRLHMLALALLIATPLSAWHFLTTQRGVDFAQDISPVIDLDKDLRALGAYIEAQHDEKVLILTHNELTRKALSASPQAQSLSWYHIGRMVLYADLSTEEVKNRFDDNKTFWSGQLHTHERMPILDRWGVNYVLYKRKLSEMMGYLLEAFPQRLELVASWPSFSLILVSQ